MMNLRFLPAIIVLAAAASCERAKEWWSDTGGGGTRTEFPTPGGEIRGDLAALVRRGPDGVVFRRDLPFPLELQGRISITRQLDGVRIVETSPLGREDRTLNEEIFSEIEFAKASGRFSMTTETLGRPLASSDGDQTASAPAKPKRREGQTLEFVLRSDHWTTRRSADQPDLGLRIWADSLAPEVPRLLVHCGAYPRTQWFSSSRAWQPGDRLTLTGRTVSLLNPFDATGRLDLVFEGEEAVGGHPCGVFSVTGDMTVRDETNFEGGKTDSDISISEGKIWASLLYPILLREEYHSVQTITRRQGGSGAPEIRSQGPIVLTISRLWKNESG